MGFFIMQGRLSKKFSDTYLPVVCFVSLSTTFVTHQKHDGKHSIIVDIDYKLLCNGDPLRGPAGNLEVLELMLRVKNCEPLVPYK